MNPCPQCGAIPQPSDKFCNVCGTPVLQPSYGGAPMQYGGPQAGYGQAPAPMQQGGMPQQGYGGQPPQAGLRCQMGHEIAPGASYCAMGHPIAMDAMPFGGAPADPYGGGGYGQQPPQQPGGFGAPPPQQGGFGAPPQQGFGAPPPAQPQQALQGGFGAPMQQPGGYYQDPNAGYGQQPAPAPFGAPQPSAPQPFGAPAQPAYPGMQPAGGGLGGGGMGGGYDSAPQPGGFGGGGGSQPNFPVPQQGGFGAPAPQPGFGSQPGFGQPAAAAPAPQAPPLPPAIPEQLPAQALRGFFVSYQTNATGDFWPLHGGRKTVGRANSGESVDIALSDATISSRHAAVNIDGTSGVVTVEDTGSTNGTFVNEEHIGFNGRRDLRDGDKVRFGGYTVIAKIVSR